MAQITRVTVTDKNGDRIVLDYNTGHEAAQVMSILSGFPGGSTYVTNTVDVPDPEPESES